MAVGAPVRGHVAGFDAGRGTGVVESDDGRQLPFHCTRLSDGSRTVDVGDPVVFEVGPGPEPGGWEATTVVKLAGGGPPRTPAPPPPTPR